MVRLRSFPHLSTAEFEAACDDLHHRFQQHGNLQEEWLSVELIERFETKYLRITKNFVALTRALANDSEEAELEEEDDEERLIHHSSPPAIIYYDIVLSPTYSVPSLYMSISDALHRYPPTLSTLYGAIVSPHYASQTQYSGVLGGVTITDHPIESKPVFFIHPCRTAEVLRVSASECEPGTDEYLLIWIGALGKCVGLNVPVAIAIAKNAKDIEDI